MPLRRMDIESVVVGEGPIASLVVLRTREQAGDGSSQQLPIRIGSFEATAITMGVHGRPGGRPMTHDLLCSVVSSLGATCVGVRIMAVQGTTFFAQVELERADGEHVFIDARPSDALALAVREEVPVYAEESVLESAAMPDFRGVEKDEEAHELEEFHNFVEPLTRGLQRRPWRAGRRVAADARCVPNPRGFHGPLFSPSEISVHSSGGIKKLSCLYMKRNRIMYTNLSVRDVK